MSLHSALKYAFMVGVFLPNWSFSVVVGCGVATKRRGVDFVIKKGVGGFAEGGRNGEGEGSTLKEWGVAHCNLYY